ncbi:hypothetical protein D3C76_1423000 [compost metagenome]
MLAEPLKSHQVAQPGVPFAPRQCQARQQHMADDQVRRAGLPGFGQKPEQQAFGLIQFSALIERKGGEGVRHVGDPDKFHHDARFCFRRRGAKSPGSTSFQRTFLRTSSASSVSSFLRPSILARAVHSIANEFFIQGKPRNEPSYFRLGRHEPQA